MPVLGGSNGPRRGVAMAEMEAGRTGATVLLVDDEPLVLAMMEDFLTVNGLSVLTAHEGSEGLRLARERNPDVIVLDVMMPVMDGYEVCERLKADPRTRGIPVILHTILKGAEVETRGEAAGADFVVHKPMRPLSLFLKTVEAALAKRREPDSAPRPPRP
ncbi:MAG TPA: response regulator [Candidatus Methylomirabilis sp.]|nr:response regulator [Candidatus Methylomirabilis sp.]